MPELMESVSFEPITGGRLGAVLADLRDGVVPLVRTTTRYHNPTQPFTRVHYDLITSIADLGITGLNNALIELYDDQYRTMGFHTDQAQDLEPGSSIAIVSYYDNPVGPLRKLVVLDKETGVTSEISLEHRSVVWFSLETNRKLRHKIILDHVGPTDNRWLGLTFRRSHTFIRFVDERPYFVGGHSLTLADDAQRKAFYSHRSNENANLDFVYPDLTYTISQGDLMQPSVLVRP